MLSAVREKEREVNKYEKRRNIVESNDWGRVVEIQYKGDKAAIVMLSEV